MDNVEDVEDDYLDIFWTSNDLSFFFVSCFFYG